MKKILIVDDTKNIRTMLSVCLKSGGHTVLTAGSGKEAIDIIINENIDLIFLDVKMPEVSGTEVLRQIRNNNIKTPIIMMTAFGTVKNAIECTKLGVLAYLQKPFTADKINKLMEEICLQEKKESLDQKLESSRALISVGKTKEAFEILKNSLSLDPSCSKAYWLIGQVYEVEGNLNEAEKFYSVSKLFR